MKNLKIFSAVLFIVGFAILIINAVVYLGGFFGFSWEYNLPSSGVGIIFLVVGIQQRLFEKTKTVKKKKT